MSDLSIIKLAPPRWQEAKALRLEALKNDPLAFGSSYEEEAAEVDTFWQQRANSTYAGHNAIALYAESNDKLIGMIVAVWQQRIKMRHNASINGVYVTPTFRGQGIGKRLMQAILEEINTIPNIIKVSLTVSAEQPIAQAMYHSFGFEVVGTLRKELKVDDTYYDEYIMEKLL